jgi:hypothetical protein
VEPLGPRIGNSRPLHSALTMPDANRSDLAQQDFGAGSCLAHPHRMSLPFAKRWGLARRQRSPQDALHGARVRHAPQQTVHCQLEVSLGVSPSRCWPGGLGGAVFGHPLLHSVLMQVNLVSLVPGAEERQGKRTLPCTIELLRRLLECRRG